MAVGRLIKPPAQTDFHELEALVAVLNRSGERVQTLWFTFLTLTLYFAISAGTTTHRMLLLEEGLSLPLVNLKLPLLGFYVIAPLLYVFLHAYFLMMLTLLARTAKTFEDALSKQLGGGIGNTARERFRMRIENVLFLQIIIGAKRERAGVNGWVLRTVALLSLAVAPVALLLMVQFMFLPYHHGWITWWHRAAVIIDLMLVWTLWPSYLREWGERLLPRWEFSGAMLIKAVTAILALTISFSLATYPGESIHVTKLTQWMERGWPNYSRLYLPNEDFSNDEVRKHLIAENTIGNMTREVYVLSLANRDLSGADLSGVDFRQTDFRNANVVTTNFSGAWLQKTRFQGAAGGGRCFLGRSCREPI